jgi:AcrR family transcriptional regulator
LSETSAISRIQRRKLQFRDKITAAALKLFEKNGVAETSIASIIKEADIAHKTFFNHFPTKDHLLLHIASTFSENGYQLFREGFRKKKNPRARMEYCLTTVAKALEGVNPHYKELLNFYLISGAQKEQFTGVIQQIIEDADREGLLKPGTDVDTYTELVVGICVAILLNWSLEDGYPIQGRMKKAVTFINNSVFIDK